MRNLSLLGKIHYKWSTIALHELCNIFRASPLRAGSVTESLSTSQVYRILVLTQVHWYIFDYHNSLMFIHCLAEMVIWNVNVLVIQELDNLKGRSILANDNLKTSSTPDDNLIEKVKVLFVENSFQYVVFLTRWTTE